MSRSPFKRVKLCFWLSASVKKSKKYIDEFNRRRSFQSANTILKRNSEGLTKQVNQLKKKVTRLKRQVPVASPSVEIVFLPVQSRAQAAKGRASAIKRQRAAAKTTRSVISPKRTNTAVVVEEE